MHRYCLAIYGPATVGMRVEAGGARKMSGHKIAVFSSNVEALVNTQADTEVCCVWESKLLQALVWKVLLQLYKKQTTSYKQEILPAKILIPLL